ncbi:hypothetical protein HDU76_013803 [Blyttiomyces sp. JEL0837]|nr:hypothetical protein HDU76_013803 [Blyttiomyces sp. JEL0837]
MASGSGFPDFNQLYEQSRQLTSHIVTPGTMPQLDRGLDQIDTQTRKLASKSSRAGDFAPSASTTSTSATTAFGLSSRTAPSQQFQHQPMMQEHHGGDPLAALQYQSQQQQMMMMMDATPSRFASVSQNLADAAAGGASSKLGQSSSTSTTTGAPPQIDARAAYLLANRGFDADKVTATLNLITPSATFEPIEGLYDTDVEGYLRMEHVTLITQVIEEGRNQTFKDCAERFDRTLQRDWEKAKKRIFEELGQNQQHLHLQQGVAGAGVGGIGSPGGLAKGVRSPAPGFNGRSSLGAVTPGGLVTAQTSSSQNDGISLQLLAKNKNYANIVQALNQKRLNKEPFDIVNAFKAVAQHLDRGEVGQAQLIQCWGFLDLLLNKGDLANTVPAAGGLGRSTSSRPGSVPEELQYVKAYRSQEEGSGLSDEAIHFRKAVVAAGKKFLQDSYYNFIVNVVIQNKSELGGTPTPVDVINQYVLLRFQKHSVWQGQYGLEIWDNVAPWATIYYLVRCGLMKDALGYVNWCHQKWWGGLGPDMKKNADVKFAGYFKEFVTEGRLSASSRNQLIEEWNSRIRGGVVEPGKSGAAGGGNGNVGRVDPFKAALYKIIGRAEMSNKRISNEVQPSVEDYLWLQLMLVQEDFRPNEDLVQDRYTLRDVAKNMVKFGANHFSPGGRSPQVYFMVLLLCGEFERAVGCLVGSETFKVEGVHFAIALAYYGVLRVGESPNLAEMGGSGGGGVGGDLVVVRAGGAPVPGNSAPYEVGFFQFERMLYQYSKPFFKNDPVDSMHYLVPIGLCGKSLGDEPVVVGGGGAGGAVASTPGGDSEKSLVPGVAAKEYTRVLHAHLRELALVCGLQSKLIGEVRADGIRVPGQIEKFGPLMFLGSATGSGGSSSTARFGTGSGGSPARGGAGLPSVTADFILRIIRPTAEEADRRGRLQDAVLLFNQAEDYDTVVGILCKQIGEVVSTLKPGVAAAAADPFGAIDAPVVVPTLTGSSSDASQSAQDVVVLRTMEVLKHYKERPNIVSRISDAKLKTCELLIMLHQFMKEAEAGRSEQALGTLRGTGVVPFEADMGVIARRAEDFRGLEEVVARSVPVVLVTAMVALARVYRVLKERGAFGGGFGGGGNELSDVGLREKRIAEVRVIARAVILFAGSIQYRIPSDTFAKLNRLEVMMS